MVRSLIVLVMCLAMAVLGPAPQTFAQGYENQTSSRGAGPRKQVAVIIFAGLAGAVLGLSTLSFYGRPQDKLANIPVGAAVGIIIGATYSTYRAASEGRNFYDNPPPDTRGMPPESWRAGDRGVASADVPLGAGWQWSF